MGGFGGIPTHRGVSYRSGMDRQYGSTTAAVLTRLPELVLPLTGWYVHDVEQKIAAIGTVTLDSEEAIQAALDEVRESRVRFRSASAEQMQVCQEKLKSDPTKQASED